VTWQTRRSDISVEYKRGDLFFELDWFEGFSVNGNPVQNSDFPR
jgi:hypothetical protein